MASPADNQSSLIALLQRQGSSSAQELALALGVSQPTVSRMLDAAKDSVIRIGRARRMRYATVRDVRGLGTHWPLFRINAQGRPQAFEATSRATSSLERLRLSALVASRDDVLTSERETAYAVLA